MNLSEIGTWLRHLCALLGSCLCISAAPLAVPVLPDPPQQHSAWAAPAAVSSNLISAVKILFELGFPDPRGCEYREVEVAVSSVWGNEPSIVQTRGWVIPAQENVTQQFVICWNGCVYPAQKVGTPADSHAEAMSLLPSSPRRFNTAIGEVTSVFSSNSLAQRVLLLLRSGEAEAALKVWQPNAELMRRVAIRDAKEPATVQSYDPYLEFAGDWAWALFDHVICAHMRGDVAVALSSARKLAEVRPQLETEAARRGFSRPSSHDPSQQEKEQPYFDFLNQLPSLLADLEQRARQPNQASIASITNIAGQPKRIAALIENLDSVQARQWGQPGMVYLAGDSIVAALIKEGDAAVGLLIDCLEKDKRLTRSVGFSRDFHRNRTVLPVASAAIAALQNILRVHFRSASEFRSYWNENKGLKLEERWHAVLNNDRAGYAQWLQAAQSIMQPDNISGVPGGFFATETPSEAGEKPKLRGEVLRAKQNPSVTELILKRANEAANEARQKDQVMGVDAIRTGWELVRILAEWDKPSFAIQPARSLMSHAIHLWPNWTTWTMSSAHELARFIPQFTQIRFSGGDTNAMREYAEWIRSASEEKVESYALDAFEPLWKNPTDPTVLAVSEWLFNDPASPWSKLPWRRNSFSNPVESELIKVPAFRRLLSRELDKRDVVGSMQYVSTNYVRYEIPGQHSGSRQVLWQGEQPPIGTKVEVRSCDWTAWTLAIVKRIPFFNPFGSNEQRDETIRDVKAMLEKAP